MRVARCDGDIDLRFPVCVTVCLVCLVMGLSGAARSEPPAPSGRPCLVFTTFPSEGLGTLFERILAEAYGRIGYDVIVSRVPAPRALVLSNDGTVDGEAGRARLIEADCPNLIRVPTPLYKNRVVAFSKQAKIDTAHGWEPLRPYRLASLRGYKYLETKTAGMHRTLVSCYAKLFAMLRVDRVDVALAEYLDSLPAFRQVDMHGIQIFQPPVAENEMYHYLNCKHAALVPKINAALKAMQREGRLRRLQREVESGYLRRARR